MALHARDQFHREVCAQLPSLPSSPGPAPPRRPQVQRAVAGSLRTLAFKNEENKNIIVDLGSLPLLIQMLRSDDTTIHYEARLRGCRVLGGWC